MLGPVVGEKSLLLLDGPQHLRERKLLLPPFHGERMRAYENVMREAADRAIDSWPVGRPFALLREMQSLTLDVILRAVFGVDEGPRLEELKQRVRDLIEPTSNRIGLVLFALSGGRFGAGVGDKFEEQRSAVDRLIYEEIARRREAADLEEREDVLSMLLLARDEDGKAMTDDELRDELVTLLLAGHETTATGLAWTFELLTHNTRVLERLRASLAAGDSAYLDAVAKEALRLRPVIPGSAARSARSRSSWAGTRSRSGSRSTRRSRRSTAAATATSGRASSGPSASSATTHPTPTPGCRSAAAPAAA